MMNNNTMNNDLIPNTIIDKTAWLSAAPPPFAGGWENPQLTPLGLFYPLSPCQVRFQRSELPRVLKALPKVFASQSLQVTYQNTPIGATCRSMDQVELEVSIFDNSRNNQDEIVLELQRRSGDALAFHRHAREIKAAVHPVTTTKRRPLMQPPAGRLLKPHKKSQQEDEEMEGVSGALELAGAMLATERFDAQNLGLQSLIDMTSHHNGTSVVAQEAATAILTPRNPTEERISQRVVAFLSCRAQTTSDHLADAEAQSSYLALIVLSQVAAAAPASLLRSFLQANTTLTTALMAHKIQDAHANEAAYAMRFLTAVCSCMPELQQQIKTSSSRSAQQFGDAPHAALANASHQFLVSLYA